MADTTRGAPGDGITSGDIAPLLSTRYGSIIAIFVFLALCSAVAGRLFDVLWFEQFFLRGVVLVGGAVVVFDLLRKALHLEGGADFLAAISIVTAVALNNWYVAAIVVLMLSGGAALERYAMRRASSVLEALAERMPRLALRRGAGGAVQEVDVAAIIPGDEVEIPPHAIIPVDGVVLEGNSTVDEAFLTGEPFQVPKTVGSEIISGAVNGNGMLVVRTERCAADSRYARIVEVMSNSRQLRPRLRRLGDVLGGWYTPCALVIAVLAWVISGDPDRFLAVLVVATPCPLLIGIPVAIIGAISLAAKRGIVIKDPAVLERISECRTALFDKTGTLTEGKPHLDTVHYLGGWFKEDVLTMLASVERYSAHPLAAPILEAATSAGLTLVPAVAIEELPGKGLRAQVSGKQIVITSRHHLAPNLASQLPPQVTGLEAVLMIDDAPAAVCVFRDAPRKEAAAFVRHLARLHGVTRVMVVSGDRMHEVQDFADRVGITEVRGEVTPEEKVRIVTEESARAPTLFVGDGINDAPALAIAHVGVALGKRNAITSEAAGAVILEPSLVAVDELFHIGASMRRIALQSAVGGMALSIIAMAAAAMGLLTPLVGALIQEGIDLVAVLNALRASRIPRVLSDT